MAMKSANGTTTKTGKAMVTKSHSPLPSNLGHKNLQSTRRNAGSAHSDVRGVIKTNLKGPYNAV